MKEISHFKPSNAGGCLRALGEEVNLAKRFTDTELWDKRWFRRLSPPEKCAFMFIKDRCSCIGIWDGDTDIADKFIGAKIKWSSLLQKLNENVVKLSNGKYWIPEFCLFQYGMLRESCPPHLKYINLLKSYGLYERVVEGYAKGSQRVLCTLEEKEKEKEEEKEEEKGVVKGDSIPYAEIIVDLNQRAGTGYRETTESIRKKIKARWNDGFRLDDFKTVHRKKCEEWKGTDYGKYMRPETLYSEKFESYLNQPEQSPKTEIHIT